MPSPSQRRSSRQEPTRKRESRRQEPEGAEPQDAAPVPAKGVSGKQTSQGKQPSNRQAPAAPAKQPSNRQAPQPKQVSGKQAAQPSARQQPAERQPSQRAMAAKAVPIGAGISALASADDEDEVDGVEEKKKKRKKRKPITGEEIVMDMTPMIDVVFQLLIFFLCATQFKTVEDIFNANLPQDEGLETTIKPEVKEKPPPVFIGIIDDNPAKDSPDREIKCGRTATFLLNGRTKIPYSTPEQEINSKLLTILKQQSNPEESEVQVYPYKNGRDNRIPFKEVIRVMDLCYQAKIKDIRFRPPVETYK